MNAELLAILLPVLARAPDGCEALAFKAARNWPCHPPSFYTAFTGDEALEGVDPVCPSEHIQELDAALVAGLQRVARRAALAEVASRMACADRACRAVVDAFASAEERAASAAQAHALHCMAYDLQHCWQSTTFGNVSEALAAWCRAENATTALDGFYDDEGSPADKWRAFAREFARTAAMPLRIWHARDVIGEHNTSSLYCTLRDLPVPDPLPNADALEELAERESSEDWATSLVDLVQGAPA